MSVANLAALGRPYRSVLAFGNPGTLVKLAILFLVLLPMLVACNRHGEPSQARGDAELGRKMIGTWSSDTFGAHSKGMTTVVPNGHYVCEIKIFGSNGVRQVELNGTLQVTNGTLVDTITGDSQTNAAPVPRTSQAQIMRLDENELVLRYEGMDRDVVLRRQKQ